MARPTVAFPAAERHRPLTITKLSGLLTGQKVVNNFLRVIMQLWRYIPGIKPTTTWWQVCAVNVNKNVFCCCLRFEITATTFAVPFSIHEHEFLLYMLI